MIVSKADEPIMAPLNLILDGRTFYAKSLVTKEWYIPAPITNILDKISMEYNIVALFPIPAEPKKLQLFQKIRKKLFGKRHEEAIRYKPPEFPFLGRHIEIEISMWEAYVRECGTPIFYFREQSSDTVTLPDRIFEKFPSSLKILRTQISNYMLRYSDPDKDRKVLKPMDFKKAKDISEGKKKRHPKFEEKFYTK